MIPQAERRKAIVEETLSWVGTPYKSCQAVKQVGADCALMLLEIYRKFGIVESSYTVKKYKGALARLRRGEQMYRAIIKSFADFVPREAYPGDVLLFNIPYVIRHSGQIIPRTSHGAIVIEFPYIVHACIDRRSVCYDDLRRIYLYDCVDSVWCPKGLGWAP